VKEIDSFLLPRLQYSLIMKYCGVLWSDVMYFDVIVVGESSFGE
jgi:hypothetical protein